MFSQFTISWVAKTIQTPPISTTRCFPDTHIRRYELEKVRLVDKGGGRDRVDRHRGWRVAASRFSHNRKYSPVSTYVYVHRFASQTRTRSTITKPLSYHGDSNRNDSGNNDDRKRPKDGSDVKENSSKEACLTKKPSNLVAISCKMARWAGHAIYLSPFALACHQNNEKNSKEQRDRKRRKDSNDDKDGEHQEGVFDKEEEEAIEPGSNLLEDGAMGLAEQAIDGLSAVATNDQNPNKKSRKKQRSKKFCTKQSDNGKNDDRKRPNDSSDDVEAAIELGSVLLEDGVMGLAEQAIDGLAAFSSDDDQNQSNKSNKKRRKKRRKQSTKQSDDDAKNSHNNNDNNNNAQGDRKRPNDSNDDVEAAIELGSILLEDGVMGLAEQAIGAFASGDDQNKSNKSNKKRRNKRRGQGTKQSDQDPKNGLNNNNNNNNNDDRKHPKGSDDVEAAIELGSTLLEDGVMGLAVQAIDGLSAFSFDDQNNSKKNKKKNQKKNKKRNKKRNKKNSDNEEENGEKENDNDKGDDGKRSNDRDDDQDGEMEDGLLEEGELQEGLVNEGAFDVEVDSSGLEGATNIEVDASGLEDGAAEAMVNLLGLFFG